jgi:hypothetical protein
MAPMRFLLAAVLLASACGGSSTKQISDPGSAGAADGTTTVVADAIPATAGPPCATVAERLAQVALAERPKNQPQAIEVVRKRCADDRWSDDARNCLATIETDDELEGCRRHLSGPQQQAVERDLDAALGSPAVLPAAKKSAPPPAPTTTPSTTRGPTRRTGADPCEGGE